MRETKKVIIIEKCYDNELISTLDNVDARENPCVKELTFVDSNEQTHTQLYNVGGRFPTDKQEWILPPFSVAGYNLVKQTYTPTYKVTVNGITYYRVKAAVTTLFEEKEGHWTFPYSRKSTDLSTQILVEKGLYQAPPDIYDPDYDTWESPKYYVDEVFSTETFGVDYYISINLTSQEYYGENDTFKLVCVYLDDGTQKTYNTLTNELWNVFDHRMIYPAFERSTSTQEDFIEFQNDLHKIKKVVLKQVSGGSDEIEFTQFSFDLCLNNGNWIGGTRYVPKDEGESVNKLKQETINLWSSSFKLAEPESIITMEPAQTPGVYLLTTDTQAKVVSNGSLFDADGIMEGMTAVLVTDKVQENEITYLGRADSYLIPQENLVLGTSGIYYVTGTDGEPVTCGYKFVFDGKNYYAQHDSDTWNMIYEEDSNLIANHFFDDEEG